MPSNARSRSWSVKPSTAPSRRVRLQQRQSVVASPERWAASAEDRVRMGSASVDDFDDRNLRDVAGLEGGKVDLDHVEVEAHRDVEGEAGADECIRCRGVTDGEGQLTRRMVADDVSGLGLDDAVHGDLHRAEDRLGD